MVYFKVWCKMKGHERLFIEWKSLLQNYPGLDPFTIHVPFKKDFPLNST